MKPAPCAPRNARSRTPEHVAEMDRLGNDIAELAMARAQAQAGPAQRNFAKT
jgi:hypothetical protein